MASLLPLIKHWVPTSSSGSIQGFRVKTVARGLRASHCYPWWSAEDHFVSCPYCFRLLGLENLIPRGGILPPGNTTVIPLILGLLSGQFGTLPFQKWSLILLSFNVSWSQWLASDIACNRNDVMSFPRVDHKETEATVLGTRACSLFLWSVALGSHLTRTLMEAYEETHVARSWRLANGQRGIEVSAKASVILGMDLSSVGSSAKTGRRADTYTISPVGTFSQNVPAKLTLDPWQTETVR